MSTARASPSRTGHGGTWISWAAQRKSVDLNDIFVRRDVVAVDVHYAFLNYADPLARRRRMHTSFPEIVTGVRYQAPWPNTAQRSW